MVDAVNAVKNDLFAKYCACEQENTDNEKSSIFDTCNKSKCSVNNNKNSSDTKDKDTQSPTQKLESAKTLAMAILIQQGDFTLAGSKGFQAIHVGSGSESRIFSTDLSAISSSDIEDMTVDELALYIITLAYELMENEQAAQNKSKDDKNGEFFKAVSGFSSFNNGNQQNLSVSNN